MQVHIEWRFLRILSTMRRAHGRQLFFLFYCTEWSAIGDHMRVPESASMPHCLLGGAARV